MFIIIFNISKMLPVTTINRNYNTALMAVAVIGSIGLSHDIVQQVLSSLKIE
jgi:hypothetical protein